MGKSAASLIMLALGVALLVVSTDRVSAFHSHHRIVRVRVLTACQGNRLSLGCNRGFSLHILAAFYGHTSSKICPGIFKLRGKHGPIKCSAKGTLDLVRKKCQDKPSCHLRALSKVFGDPCHGVKVRKYLRVQFTCRFHDCRRVARLQEKLVRLIARYGELAKKSYGYWRRRHYKRRQQHLVMKLNSLRRKFHFCFKCQRGCQHLHDLLNRLLSAKARIESLLSKLLAEGKPPGHHTQLRWRASCAFLRRKLEHLRIRERVLQARLGSCTRKCNY